MLIRNRPSFITGMILTFSFAFVLLLIFAPVFGEGRNGLEYADDMFNKLSKGSSYFLPKVSRHAEAMAGKTFKLDLPVKALKDADAARGMYAAAGLAVVVNGENLQIEGDIGKLLSAVLQDAEDGFRNDEAALQERYALPARTVLANWWQMMNRLDKSLKLEKRVPEAKAVTEVMKKGVEPAHNYFGIEAEKVSDMIPEMLGLLVFYVLYTVWWGYAILKLLEGLGLVLKSH